MISCFELRIGNYLLVDENLQQVSAINHTTAFTVQVKGNSELREAENNLDNIEPVPLTDDILKKAGLYGA